MFENLTGFSSKDTGLEKVDINERTYIKTADLNPSVLVVLAFGSGTDSNSYNAVLADAAEDAKEHFDNISIIAQAEVADILEGRSVECEKVGEKSSDSTIKPKYSTAEIIKKTSECNLDRIYLAHPAHIERVERIGYKQNLPGGLITLEEVKWPSEDPQKWVRSPINWALREIFVRMHHKIKGWI